jgi:hypothetical protein
MFWHAGGLFVHRSLRSGRVSGLSGPSSGRPAAIGTTPSTSREASDPSGREERERTPAQDATRHHASIPYFSSLRYSAARLKPSASATRVTFPS